MLADALVEIDGSAVDLVDEAQREVVDTRAMIADVLAELAPPPPPPPPPAEPMPPAPDAPAF